MAHRRPMRRVGGVLALAPLATAYTMVPRWGHASTFLPDPPTLVIQGGKTDPGGGYSYTSAPNSADTILLPLGQSFDAASPPTQLAKAGPEGPAYAWHCIAPLGSGQGNWNLLSYGGDGGWDQHSDTDPDSVWLANINPVNGSGSFTHQPTGWANQPSRRVLHSCAAPLKGGDTFVSGGMDDNGSGETYASTYKYDPAAKQFSTLAPLPVPLYHHASVLLENNTLVAFGGVIAPKSGQPHLTPFDTLFTLQTDNEKATWKNLTVGGPAPSSRRGASATLNPDGTIFVFGGADLNLSTAYGDGWVLDPKTMSWTEVVASDQGPGGRYDHTAVDVGGGQIVVFGGFGPNLPVNPEIHLLVLSGTTAAATSTFTPTPYVQSGSGGSGGNGGNGNGINGNADGGANGNGNGNGNGNSNGNGNGSGDGDGDGNGNGAGGGKTTRTRTGGPQPTTTNTTSAGAHNPGLTNGRLAALIVGLGLAVLLAVLLFIFARRRHKRKHTSGRGNDRAYTEKPSGALLRDPEAPVLPPFEPTTRRQEAMAALGIGIAAVGAAAVTAGRKISGRAEGDYTQLDTSPNPDRPQDDLGGGVLGIIRRSTRRIGRGIRLIGPTRSIDDPYDEDLPPIQPTVKGSRSRFQMLNDEDTRRFSSDMRARAFSTIPEEGASAWKEDWVLDSKSNRRDWRTGDSLLSRSDQLAAPPAVRGGPVPTPAESLRGGPFNSPDPSVDAASQIERAATPSLYDSFKVPAVAGAATGAALGAAARPMSNPFNHSQDSLMPDDAISSRQPESVSDHGMPASTARPLPIRPETENRMSSHSIPISATSSNSQRESLADVGDAMIASAEIASRTPVKTSILSRRSSTPHSKLSSTNSNVMFSTPPESPRGLRPAQNPVLRQVSLLRRISSGFLTRRDGHSRTASGASRDFDVRDPAPQPTDWPLRTPGQSLSSHAGSAEWHKASSSEEGFPLPLGAQHRPSITEVGSIRSMGDMHVIQREVSLSSDEAHIERLDTPDLISLSASPVSPHHTGGGIGLGIQQPTMVLRTTNPGRTPSGSTYTTDSNGNTPPQLVTAVVPPALRIGSSSPQSAPSSPVASPRLQARRLSSEDVRGFSLLTPTTTNTSNSSVPSSSLPWGAQASPHSSPRSFRDVPLSPARPPLTITTGATSIPGIPSPLSPTHTTMSRGSHSSDGSHLSKGSGSTTASSSLLGCSTVLDHSTPTPMGIATADVVRPPNAFSRSTPLLTPSPRSRRPVHDIVASINRRSGALPSHFGPNGTPHRSLSGSPASPTRTYEIARRDPLIISNPDQPQ